MAVYRLGDMIRMRREALHMTRNQLTQKYSGWETEEEQEGCPVGSWQGYGRQARNAPAKASEDNEICSVQVLHRIENGDVKRVKTNVFRGLMMKMGLLPERFYTFLMVTECRGLRLKSEVAGYISRQEYQEAEAALGKLESLMVWEYPRNLQYLETMKAKLAWKKGKMRAEQYLEILQKALRYTIPKLDGIDMAEWPVNTNEFDILTEIAKVYHTVGNSQAESDILLKLMKNAERKYMDGNHYTVRHGVVLRELSELMCRTNQYEKALEYCRTGIQECKKQRIIGEIYQFLLCCAWISIHSQAESPEQEDVQKERTTCRKLFVQAYYLSVAQGDIDGAERIKKIYEFYNPDAAKLL